MKKGEAIFPRLDIEKELAELEAMKKAGKETKNIPLELKPEIEYDDFDKIDFRVGPSFRPKSIRRLTSCWCSR